MANEFIQGKGKPTSSQYCLLLPISISSKQESVHFVPSQSSRFRALLRERYGYSYVRAKVQLDRLVREFHGKNKKLEDGFMQKKYHFIRPTTAG